MEKPLTSIIIPAYNAEKYIEEAVHSALQSTYSPLEIVIVNDGSTDRTLEIAQNLSSQYANVIRTFSQSNKGASSARNLAIKHAEGKYILPLDADNLISPDYVAEAVKELEKNSAVKLVSCEAYFIGEKNGKWNFQPFDINLLCRRNIIDNCAMFRKQDWKIVGGYCNEILGREDWDFWLSLFERGGEFVRLPIYGLYYRVRSDSKRIKTRHLHKEIIDMLNIRHKPLFYKELGGKLHYQRTHSQKINSIRNWFRPHKVVVNTSDYDLIKMVYAANEPDRVKKILNTSNNPVNYISFKEKRFHFPGSKIRKSKAGNSFNSLDKNHLGYYEQQISFFTLQSFLITLK